MDVSNTQLSSTATNGGQLLNYDEIQMFGQFYQLFARYSDLVICPAIGVVGLVGNVLSVVIMLKDGLHKPSNILLLGLAVADFSFLLDTVNVPLLMHYASPVERIWFMDLENIVVCYSLTMAVSFVSKLGDGMSTSLTVFITLERVVAVFFPLRFSRLVTPTRATAAVVMSFIMALPIATLVLLKVTLSTGYFKTYGGWLGIITFHNRWLGSGMHLFDEFIVLYIKPIVPATIVIIGCVLIGVKVSLTIRRRQKLTFNKSKRNSSARARTLFMVSFLFSVTNVIKLFTFLPQLNNGSNHKVASYFITLIYSEFVRILMLNNNATNFFIYVIFHPKFRKQIALFFCDCQRKK